MLPDRNKPTLKAYLLGLDGREGIKVVTIDMWRPYWNVVREVLPQAVIVIDKFHVTRLANDALDLA